MNAGKIITMATNRPARRPKRRLERGYLLVGLLAALTVTMIGLAAATPQIAFDMQREREEEMLWRGQQIAMALDAYTRARGGQFPLKLEELVEGVNTGVKKMRFLRPHALCDPLLPCKDGKSNWTVVRMGDPRVGQMLQTMQAYIQKKSDDPNLQRLLTQSLQSLMRLVQQSGGAAGLGGGGLGNPALGPIDPTNPQASLNRTGQAGQGGVSFADSSLGGLKQDQLPIVGVVSRSQERPIRNMLDIENYDKGLFYAGGTVIAGGFITPYFAGAQQAAAPAVNPCPGGGFLLPGNDGQLRCFGGVVKGPQERPADATPK